MNQNINYEQESGRSMVEMLGVLAIIGVLSVGGISGYTTAMNKHKANEILNAAAVRAMAVSAQIQSGVDPSTATAGVTTETVGTAEIGSASPVGTEQFKLVFTNDIDESICNQMKNISGENSAVGVACDRLLYNNDMSPGVGSNTNPDNRKSDGTCKDDFDGADCDKCKDTTKVYTNGVCASSAPKGSECETTCSATTGSATCNNGYCECESGVWVSTDSTDLSKGNCVATPEGDGCFTNKDCNSGSEKGTQYCNYNGNVNSSSGPTGKGVCIETATDYDNTITINNHDYVLSRWSDPFDWWSAKNFCAAYGKHMMSLPDLVGCESDLNCTIEGTLFQQLYDALPESSVGGCSWTTTLSSSSHAYLVDGVAGNLGHVFSDYRGPHPYSVLDGGGAVFCR